MIKAPFPWFGGKSRVSKVVWERFGNTPKYVEPFAGSLGVLLSRPENHKRVNGLWPIETVNDLDGFICNTWRAIQAAPEEVFKYIDWPVNECDKHARELWLVRRRDELSSRIMADPDYFDAKIAGWWLWGICIHIGGGWCKGQSVWTEREGLFIRMREKTEPGVMRNIPYIRDAGIGVHRILTSNELQTWVQELCDRLRRVRVVCGDWKRLQRHMICEAKSGYVGVFLDPPYNDKNIKNLLLYKDYDKSLSSTVRQWAIENGDNPKLRVALCGYEGEHAMPETWDKYAYSVNGGYGNQGNKLGRENKHRERVWFSPHCLRPDEGGKWA